MLVCDADAIDRIEDTVAGLAFDPADAQAYRGARREADVDGVPLVILTFQTGRARDALADRLADAEYRATVGIRSVRLDEEADRDWVAEVAARDVGVPLGQHLAALPEAAKPLAGRTGIRVRRSRAFGTGDHPSTRLAAALVEKAVRPASTLLDVGAGTGILAAVGLLSGASAALALENDRDACALATETRQLNNLEPLQVVCGTPACLSDRRFDTVVANIERDTLLDLMPRLARAVAPGGSLILSGLLVEQADSVASAGRKAGLVELERCTDGEWAGLLLVPRPAIRPTVVIDAPEVRDERIELPDEQGHHLVRVRRSRPGDAVLVVNGRGDAWSGILAHGSAGSWQVAELRPESPQVESPLQIHLLPAIAGERGPMEQLVRAATELGVQRLIPVVAERSQSGRRRRQEGRSRWSRIAREAVKQSGRVVVPEVEPARSLKEVLAAAFDGVTVAFDPAGATPQAGSERPGGVRLLVGPEGGWTPAELAALRVAGVRLWRLGPRILRVETAAAAAVALAQYLWGDWAAPSSLP